MKKRTSGYSLIEVLVAIAITSIVLLTVLSLFYMGRRNVYGGKQMTQAVAVLEVMTVSQFRTNFALTDNATGNITVPNVPGRGDIVYPASVARDSSGCTVAAGPVVTCTNDPYKFMANWYSMLLVGTNKDAVLATPSSGLVITPRLPRVPANDMTTAQFTRIRVYVAWDETPKARRYAFFDTTKEQ